MDPLTPLAVSAATQSIKPLARGVGRLSEFAAVLAHEVAGTAEGAEGAAEGASQAVATTSDAASLREAVAQQLDRLLNGSWGGTAGRLEFEVTEEGRLRLQKDHPRGAEIEAVLNGDPKLRELTAAWQAVEKSPIQLSWSASNLTQPGNLPYIMG